MLWGIPCRDSKESPPWQDGGTNAVNGQRSRENNELAGISSHMAWSERRVAYAFAGTRMRPLTYHEWRHQWTQVMFAPAPHHSQQDVGAVAEKCPVTAAR